MSTCPIHYLPFLKMRYEQLSLLIRKSGTSASVDRPKLEPGQRWGCRIFVCTQCSGAGFARSRVLAHRRQHELFRIRSRRWEAENLYVIYGIAFKMGLAINS